MITNNNFFQIIYISETDNSHDHDVLMSILKQSDINNKINSVTGVLIYNGGVFLQLLEGRNEDILALYSKILIDKRHSKIKKIYEGYSNSRIFNDWTMAHKNINEYASDIREKIETFIYSESQGDELIYQEDAIKLIKLVRNSF